MFTRISLSLCIIFLSSLALADGHPTGMWTTIDDETNQPKSRIEITEINGVLSGKIVELLNPSEPNPLCKKCKGDLKNQPILGLTIITDTVKKGDYWKGTILDPKKGKTYKLKLTVVEGDKALKVRGYIGSPLLGRTQVWVKQ